MTGIIGFNATDENQSREIFILKYSDSINYVKAMGKNGGVSAGDL